MIRELIDAFDRTDGDDAVRVVIVTGRGRGFCAGADLSSGGRPSPPVEVATRRDRTPSPVTAGPGQPAYLQQPEAGHRRHQRSSGRRRRHDDVPMDLRLASEDASIGFVFARRGIVPEACSSWFLPRLVGIQQATEWVYTGRVFSAAEALAGGLVRSVHKPKSCSARPAPRPGDRREHSTGVGRAVAPDAVADARRRTPDDRPPGRLPGHRRARPQRRRPRRRHVVPGEAATRLPRPRERRAAADLPWLGGPRVRLGA